MRAVARWFGVALVCLAGCGGAPEYVSEEGRFAVRLPAPPTTETDPELPRGVHKISHVERSGSFAVAWEDLANAKGDASEQLDRACDAAVKKLKGKQVSRRQITLNDHPGRELLVEWPDRRGLTRQRMYLVDGRLYHIVASGLKWWMDRAETGNVLDSFRLVAK